MLNHFESDFELMLTVRQRQRHARANSSVLIACGACLCAQNCERFNSIDPDNAANMQGGRFYIKA